MLRADRRLHIGAVLCGVCKGEIELMEGKGATAQDIDLSPDMSASAAFRAIICEGLRQYRLNEVVLKEGHETEALHHARVALRRLRSALSAFRPVLRRKARRHFNAELRWLAAEYGMVRDIDVLLPLLKGAHLRAGEVIRDERFAHLQRTLGGHRAASLPDALSAWVEGKASIRRSARHRDASDCARHAFDALFADLKATRHDLSAISASDRHELRKQVKKLRYVADFFAALYDKGKAHKHRAAFMDELKLLQGSLGELNDMAVRPTLLQELGLKVSGAISSPDEDALLKEAGHALARLTDRKPFWR